jgi:hypothetical protein
MGRIGEALAEAHRIAWEDPAPEWFAPARTTVEGLDAAAAAAPPGTGLNAPWQVVRHLRTGFALWRRWLADEPADPADFGAPDEWTPVAEPSPDSWATLVTAAIAEERALRAVVAGLADETMLTIDARFGETPLSLAVGLVAHTSYHAGELRTLASTLGR